MIRQTPFLGLGNELFIRILVVAAPATNKVELDFPLHSITASCLGSGDTEVPLLEGILCVPSFYKSLVSNSNIW
jgi:hypothetical protein